MLSSSFHAVRVHCGGRGMGGVQAVYKRYDPNVPFLSLQGLHQCQWWGGEVYFSDHSPCIQNYKMKVANYSIQKYF